jgi:hypothetical protein
VPELVCDAPVLVAFGTAVELALCVELVVRSMISGGGARRQPRPSRTPKINKADSVSVGRSQCVRTSARKHLSQNLRLVQANQRSRTIFAPHSQQKFGR